MATNWPPLAGSYPAGLLDELGCTAFSFSSLAAGVKYLRKHGFTYNPPTQAENQSWFQGVRCDEGHLCTGIVIVSNKTGNRYPIATYCNNAGHRSGLSLFPVQLDNNGNPVYDLGALNGVVVL